MKVFSTSWRCALQLDSRREVVAGSQRDLSRAIGRGADLRIYTEFRHNEHIDVESASDELIREVAEFGVTYLVDGQWSAGVMTLRQPISLPDGFGERPSMSFFLYNQDASQAIARPYLDGKPASGQLGPSELVTPPNMPRYVTESSWDSGTNAPSSNFAYEFDTYRYCVCDNWLEVLRHDENGQVLQGSIGDLRDAVTQGCSVKVGIQNLAESLGCESSQLDHEVFVQLGPCYFYTDQNLMIGGSHPLVRVKPAVPMRYQSGKWDFGWLMVRSDGQVVYRRCDPYTLGFNDMPGRCGLRWFVR